METNKVTCIMIADDNVNWANILEKYLQQNMKNIQIVANVCDGEKEVELASKLKPDIIITDLIRKTGISGLQAIKKCKEFNLNEIKFIVETATCNIEEKILLQEIGITDILIKPFDMDKLIEIIKEMR